MSTTLNTTETKTKFSLSMIRELYKHINAEQLRDILTSDYLDNDKDLKRLINGLKNNFIDVDTFLNGDFIYDDSSFYDSDDYCETRDGDILYREDAYYCMYFDEYTSNEVFKCYIGRYERWYCERAIEREGLHEYQGDYYDWDGLSYNNLVLTEEGDIMEDGDAYYWDSDGCMHSEPEPEDEDESEIFIRDYHHNTRVYFKNFTDSPRFYIGYEIEKEDKEVKESININDFEDSCNNWRKERDGSLTDSKGFELISPCIELKTEQISEYLKSNEVLIKHINADIDTDTCGGHINISEAGLTGAELFNKIEGYTPLFHALYYKRIDKNWSKGKSNKDLKNDLEKYQSIRIHSNRLEYRIISAVPNIDTLIWRTKLFELILNAPTNCPKIAFYNIQTILKNHLNEMYKNGRFDKLIERVIQFTEKYEGIILSKGAEQINN